MEKPSHNKKNAKIKTRNISDQEFDLSIAENECSEEMSLEINIDLEFQPDIEEDNDYCDSYKLF